MFVRKKTIDEFKDKILSLEEGLHKQRIKTDKQQEIIDFLAKYGKDHIEIKNKGFSYNAPFSLHYEALLLRNGKLTTIDLSDIVLSDIFRYDINVVENLENHFVVKVKNARYFKINKDSGGYVEVTEFYKPDEKSDEEPTEKSDETT